MRREMLTPGLKVGLLGGSFNPAHEGHLHLTRMCLQSLGLDRVWWLVSPGNPLKPGVRLAQSTTVRAKPHQLTGLAAAR